MIPVQSQTYKLSRAGISPQTETACEYQIRIKTNSKLDKVKQFKEKVKTFLKDRLKNKKKIILVVDLPAMS